MSRLVRSSAVAVFVLVGCSPSSGSTGNPFDPAAPSGGGGAKAAETGGATNGTGAASTGTGAVLTTIPTDPGPSGGGAAGACAALTLKPEVINVDKMIPMDVNCTAEAPEPIAIYVVLDNSGSMDDDHKWPNAVDALTMFVSSDPSASGAPWACADKDGNAVMPPTSLAAPGSGTVSVALQYFNTSGSGGSRRGGGGSNTELCDGSAQRTPAVPMGPLPANGPPIVRSLNNNGPNGNTPTVGALTGGEQYCEDYQAMNPGKKCVVVLVTDGQPNGCNLSSDCGGSGGGSGDCVDPMAAGLLVPIATNAFMQSGVRTFTMGMSGVTPEGFALLDQIAAAGGGDCTPGSPGSETCDITTSGAQGFLAALDTIRKTVQVTSNSSKTVTSTTTERTTLQCEWGIPQPPAGQTIDKQLVNVTVTTGGATEPLGNVASAADCAAAGRGWYYDDPAAPTRILVCPQTCTAIQSAPNTTVDVLVGCATVPAMVR